MNHPPRPSVAAGLSRVGCAIACGLLIASGNAHAFGFGDLVKTASEAIGDPMLVPLRAAAQTIGFEATPNPNPSTGRYLLQRDFHGQPLKVGVNMAQQPLQSVSIGIVLLPLDGSGGLQLTPETRAKLASQGLHPQMIDELMNLIERIVALAQKS